MPAKNINKEFIRDSFYHVYNRGVSKQEIFLDEQDYGYFLGLLKRHLDIEVQDRRSNHGKHAYYGHEVELLAYCLMPNHFHLLLYQTSPEGMTHLMKSVGVAYSMYFNKRYRHVGAVWQQRYRAVRITDDAQLAHISRYIHMNPQDYRHWQWSSIGYFIGDKSAAWINPDRLPEVGNYGEFLRSYEDRREELMILKEELAG